MAKDLANTLAAAKLINLTVKPKVLRNSIGKRDKVDFIRFDLTKTSTLDLRASKLGGKADITFLDGLGQVIRQFKRVRKNQIFNEALGPGTYYVQIAAKNRKSFGNYTLRMAAKPEQENISWQVISPGANQIPEGFVLPGEEAQYSGGFSFQGSNAQTFRLSQLVNGEILSQILDRDGSSDSSDSSVFPFISFSLNGPRSLSKVEVEKIELRTNGSSEIVDYSITLFVSNNGKGSSSTGSLRLPDAAFSNDNLKSTDITIALFDGTPFSGSDKSEWIYGSSYNDIINGNNGDDYIIGGNGDDALSGGNGDDYLNGGAGNDRLDGGFTDDDSNNTLRGGTGDDYYVVRDSGDDVYELQGGGTDTIETHVSYRMSDSNDFGSTQYVEILILAEGGGAIDGEGSSEANSLIGNSSNNILNGEEGNDSINAGNGNDLLVGNSGQDTLVGGNGLDTFAFDFPDSGIDTIKDFQPGSDLIRIYQNFNTGDGFLGSSGFEQFWYDENIGNLSFGLSLVQSTVFARLENKPSLNQLSEFPPLLFSSDRAEFEF